MSLIEKKRKEVHKLWLKKTGKSANFIHISDSDVCTLFWLIDDIFFRGEIKQKLNEMHSTLKCALTKRKSGIAGSCSQRGCAYTMSINLPTFSSIFGKGEKKMYTNGLLCYDTLECLQLVMEHEIIHLLLFLWGYYEQTYRTPSGMTRRVHQAHGKLFQCMARTIFGHTAFRHSLGLEAEGMLKKDDVHVGMMVQFTSKSGEVHKVQIIKMNPKTAVVQGAGGEWKVSYPLLRRLSPEIEIPRDGNPLIEPGSSPTPKTKPSGSRSRKSGAKPPDMSQIFDKLRTATPGSRLTKMSAKVGMTVQFEYQGTSYHGKITRINPARATVETPTGKFLMVYVRLIYRPDLKIDLPVKEDPRNRWKLLDTVQFKHKGENLIGNIIKMNPKTAKIAVGERIFTVTYGLLSK
jgi:hypothetical protein